MAILSQRHPPFSYFIYWSQVPVLVSPDAFGVVDVPVKSKVMMLAASCTFWIVHQFRAYQIDVPKGFMSDGPSVPLLAQVFLRDAKADVPAFFHDVGYYTQGFGLVPKEAWDHYFSKAMTAVGQTSWKMGVMYLAVKRAGHKAWRDRSPIDEWNESRGIHPTITEGTSSLEFSPNSNPVEFAGLTEQKNNHEHH